MKKLLSFEFWQKFGKCLMVVIAVMPAAGLMVSIGNSLPLISDAEWLARVGNSSRKSVGALLVTCICYLL